MTFVIEKEKHRVIDYQRNISMVAVGNPHPGLPSPDDLEISHWHLNWDDDVIEFSAAYSQEVTPEGSREIKWTVCQAVIPEQLKQKKTSNKRID